MAPTLNSAVDSLAPPVIPSVGKWAKAYDGKFGPLIDLSQAVPGYPPPPEMLHLLGETASSAAMTGYGAIEGEPALRVAYAKHLSQFYGAEISASQTHITSGCNQAFAATIMAIAGAGDTIVMSNPYYFNHDTTLSILGVKARFVDCDPDNNFWPDMEKLRKALDGVKALSLVSPNNPTGSIYPPKLLLEILDECRKAGVWLILDETYRDFMDENQVHTLFQQEGWEDHLIQLYSFSKSFCIPGHRLGAVTASQTVIAAIAKVMDNLQICAPRAAQSAVAKAIEPLAEWRQGNRAIIEERAQAFRETLAETPEWKIAAMGAYFVYVEHPFEGSSSTEVAQKMGEQIGVSCLPGAFFGEGQERYLRLAFANADVETIRLLSARLKNFKL